MKTVEEMPRVCRGECDALGVVAGGGRDDAESALLGAEPGDPDVGAAGLEGAGALEVLALERHLPADQRGEPARLLHRRVDGEAVEERRARSRCRPG
jgi:hypothetical protein